MCLRGEITYKKQIMTPKHPSESLTILTDLVLPSETNALTQSFWWRIIGSNGSCSQYFGGKTFAQNCRNGFGKPRGFQQSDSAWEVLLSLKQKYPELSKLRWKFILMFGSKNENLAKESSLTKPFILSSPLMKPENPLKFQN